MQRPTPLPAPPVPVERRTERTAATPAARPADAVALGDGRWTADEDAQPTAPLGRPGDLLGITPSAWIGAAPADDADVRDHTAAPEPGDARETARALSRPGPTAADADVVEGEPTPLLGVRDVWRAARARRRALRAEVRRFTGRQRRRRLAWTAGAASVVVLALATLGAAYSPLFAVEQVRVVAQVPAGAVGAGALDVAAVEAALDDQLGTPLPLVDASEVKAALVAFPLVESFSLEARPPHELVVRVVERTPVGVVQSAAGYTLVDAAGVALATTPTPPAGQPLVRVPGGVDGDVFAAVGRVVRAIPADLRAQVTEVSATSVDDVSFVLGGSNAQVVWGSADDSALKATVLATTLAVRPLGTVAVYDVSAPTAVVVR